jgi:hypothetical protein
LFLVLKVYIFPTHGLLAEVHIHSPLPPPLRCQYVDWCRTVPTQCFCCVSER